MTNRVPNKNINAMRRFNRFYTRQMGLFTQGLLKTKFSLTQARIMFELAQRERSTSKDIVSQLNIDPAYLSRILSSFEKEGLIKKLQLKSDNRQWLLRLTARGKKTFSLLNNRAQQQVKKMLQNLTGEVQERLINAMHTVEDILEPKSKSETIYLLRSHRPGDIGWMTYRHGVLYWQEYRWDETFEALVADILAKFIQKNDPRRERIWIAEQDGEPVGSIMIVDAGNQVAQLRLLLVEPKARGRGLGKRLIDECVDFSKRCGYKKIKLWTQSSLLEARHLYVKAGFKVVGEKTHHSFGHDLVAEFWELPLRG